MERTASERDSSGPTPALPLLGPPLPQWTRLTHTIYTCTRCHLSRSRTRAVAYRGAPHPWLVLVGEAPGAEEDRVGLPFVGRGGKLLDQALASAGLRVEEYGIINVLKCRPIANRFDVPAAETCRPYLDRQLEILNPVALVTLGSRALHALAPAAAPVLQVAGGVLPGSKPPLFPMVHPAATFRARRLAERWSKDLRQLGEWVKTVRPGRP